MKVSPILLVALVGLCVLLPGSAHATQTASLNVTLDPNKLGASTTITIGFKIGVPAGQTASPLVDVQLRLPAGVTDGLSTLGVESCNSATLVERGPDGCPPDALIGHGRAVVAVPLGSNIVQESVRLTIFMAPSVNGHTAMLFYARGTSPVIARLVFPGLLLGDSGAFGAMLDTTVPVIPGLPDAPTAALVEMQSSIGPKGLTYYKRVHGTVVRFSPEGFSVPAKCPVGGFPFGARFTFQDGTVASATSTAPCPRRGRRHHRPSG